MTDVNNDTEKPVVMTDAEKAIFNDQVNLIVRMALTASETRPSNARLLPYAVLVLIGATVKLAICGEYKHGPFGLSKTLTRMWDATKFVGKAVNAAGGSS